MGPMIWGLSVRVQSYLSPITQTPPSPELTSWINGIISKASSWWLLQLRGINTLLLAVDGAIDVDDGADSSSNSAVTETQQRSNSNNSNNNAATATATQQQQRSNKYNISNAGTTAKTNATTNNDIKNMICGRKENKLG
eukprot:scaffold4402_cov324-Alexandrium_tamarense.AAC.2